jgi:ABC-type transport system involved in multi-copper enzyme maturation permease subunit
MRGFAVELRRLLSRRLVHVLAILVVAAIVFGGVMAAFQARKNEGSGPSAQAEQKVTRDQERQVQRCLSGRFGPVPDDPQEARDFCESQFSFEVSDPRMHLTDISDILLGISVLIMILMWLVGASFIGAEWRHGTITTLLTWEPRRIRLMLAKVAAVALFGFVVSLLIQLAVAAAVAPSAYAFGTTAGADSAWLWDLIQQSLRIAGVGAVMGAVGFALASLGRNTAAALGVGFAYVVVVENLIRALKPGWQPWFFSDNAAVLITADPSILAQGDYDVARSIFVVGGYTLLLLVAAIGIFRSRDVT